LWNEIAGRPSVILFLSLVTGISIFRYINLLFVPLIFLAAGFLFIKDKVSVIIILVLLSSWWASKNYNRYMDSIERVKSLSGSRVNAVCRVKDISKYGMVVDNLIIENDKYYGVLNVNTKEKFHHGDTLLISGKIYENRINSIERREFQTRLIGTFYPDKVTLLSSKKFSLKRSLYLLRQEIKDRLSPFFTTEERDLIMAMVLGIDEDLNYEIYKNFKATGLIHTLVASGAQVSILVAGLIPFIKGGWIAVLFLLIVLYSFITGLGVSIIRAGIMMGINLIARVLNEDYDPFSSLAFSGSLILLFDPFAIFGTSFQLSFLATFSLIGISPLINIKRLNFIIPTLTVQGILAPLLLYKNGSLPLISFPINVIVAPLISILTIGGFILALSTFTFPFITSIISIIIKPVIYLLLRTVNLGNSMTYNIDYSPSIMELIAMYIIIGGLIYLGYTGLHKDNK